MPKWNYARVEFNNSECIVFPRGILPETIKSKLPGCKAWEFDESYFEDRLKFSGWQDGRKTFAIIVQHFLQEGWEPFAAVGDGELHFRRAV